MRACAAAFGGTVGIGRREHCDRRSDQISLKQIERIVG
jgi:hypothetical protein